MESKSLDDMQVVWTKWTCDVEGKDYGKTFWTLRDISKYNLVTNDKYTFYVQSLEFNWKNTDGHCTESICLSSYPRLTSKEHLILLCNIERPYIPKNGDIIEGPNYERYVVRIQDVQDKTSEKPAQADIFV